MWLDLTERYASADVHVYTKMRRVNETSSKRRWDWLYVVYHACSLLWMVHSGKLCVRETMLNNNISIINRTGYDTIIHSVELGVEYNESRDRVCLKMKKKIHFRSTNYDGCG